MIVGAAAFIFIYIILGNCPMGHAVFLPLLPLDQAVPLLPWTLFIYLSDYLFVVLVLWNLKEAAAFNSAFYQLVLAALISFAIFLIFPTTYPRPLIPQDGLWSALYSWLHFVDLPTNCFPSLHVSITVIAAAALPRQRPALRWGGYAWASAICLSTLTTKQHYVLDILGGMFVAMASIWFYSHFIRRPASIKPN